jgi:ABC-type dipeptide/oligopeptide/nickel transport system permease component
LRRYILNRVLLGIITVFGVSIIVFVAARLSGDIALLYAPQNATAEELQVVREHFGTDKPIPVQYWIFIKDALQGDFGTSITYGRPAIEVVLKRMPVTLELGIISFILGNFLGILLGILAAIYRSKWMQWGGQSFALLGQAVPGFWLAVMLMLVFAVKLHWLPTSGIGGISHMILPVISLSWFSVAFVMRITRSSLLDTLDSEYVKLARIKGNPEWVVIVKHALRNALIPVVMLMGMQLAMLIGGSAFIEMVFRWPGIGQLMVNSITARDYPIIQAITLVTSTALVFIMLLVDILFVYLDPRIKYE